MTIKVTYNVTDVYVTQDVSPVYINVSYSTGGGGGAAVWGGITGTLSDQTDLQTALDAKVPYTGATQDVSLGEYGINVGNLIYDTTPTGIPTEQGATYWDDQSETVALVMHGTIQKIGEDTFYHVKNSTGSTIAKGVAVRFAGTDGGSGKILIAPFLADGTYPTQYYMGITAEAITNGSDGKVYHFGKIRGVNTSAFADGDILYCSTTVAGGFQTTAPSAPNNIVIAAAVINAANNGTLMVRTTTGSNINTDEGVLLTTPTSGQVLKYNGSLWVNDSVSGALGYTPANSATTLTINGVTYDLSANRSWTVSGGISGSGASGQVAYWDGTTSQAGSSTFLFTPTSVFDISNSVTAATAIARGTRIRPSLTASANNDVLVGLDIEPTFSSGGFTGINNYGIRSKGVVLVQLPTSGANEGFSLQYVADNTLGGTFTSKFVSLAPGVAYRDLFFSSRAVLFQQQGFINSLFISTAGNTVLGSITDSGQRLQVQGTTLLNGNVTFSSATGMTWDATNGLLGIGTSTPFTTTGGAKGLVINSGANSDCQIRVQSNATGSTATDGFLFSLNSSLNAYLWNYESAALIFGTNNAERFRVVSNGNVLIGSTSDSGERLQVTGTMKVTGSSSFGDGTTSTILANSSVSAGSNQLNLQASTANTNTQLDIRPSGTGNGMSALQLRDNSTGAAFSNLMIIGRGNATLPSTGVSYIGNIVAQVPNSDSFHLGFLVSNSTLGRFEAMRMFNSGNAIFQSGGTYTDIASALVQMTSTTKGFLPPRMTNAQRIAISSPAVGLIVYCTDMVEGLYVYKSAGWTFVI